MSERRDADVGMAFWRHRRYCCRHHNSEAVNYLGTNDSAALYSLVG